MQARTIEEMEAKGFRPAEFTEEWLKGNPEDAGRDIYAKPKSGDTRQWIVWKVGQVSTSKYHGSFIKLK